jgi:hypothetical protein
MNPQEAFLEMLIAAMLDAAKEKKLTQLLTQLDANEGRGAVKLKRVRVVIIPDELDHTWPSHAPLGSAGNG